MSYHGLSGLGLSIDAATLVFAPKAQTAPQDWRAAVKAAASRGANAVTAVPAKERLESPRKAAWTALQSRFMNAALLSSRPNTGTDPAQRLLLEEWARVAVKNALGTGVPSGAPTAQSQVQWARDAAPAVDAVRAAHAATLAIVSPPPPPPTTTQPAVLKTAPITTSLIAPVSAKTPLLSQTPVTTSYAPSPSTQEPSPSPQVAYEPPKSEPSIQQAEKERYAPPAIPAIDTLDPFPGLPSTDTTQQQAETDTSTSTATPVPATAGQVARPGLLGVPWLWWGIGGAVVLGGGAYAAYRSKHVTPNRRRMKRNAKMKFWTVKLHRREIDMVPYTADMTADEVKRSLVNHDGYDPQITVHASRKKV